MLMAALQYADVPGYSAIVFRRTFSDLALPGAIMDRAYSWLKPTKAHWDGIKKQWRFPSGARLSFGYLQSRNDRFRYQSAEFQFVGFEELTHWEEERDYAYLFSRLRSPASMTIPLRMRSSTNPGGAGHEWVFKRWRPWLDDAANDKARSGEIRRMPMGRNRWTDRTFIRALMSDNPSLDAEEYRDNLSELDTVTRAQLEDGSWLQDTSGLMYRVAKANIHEGAFVRSGAWTFMFGHDYGVTNQNAISVAGWRKDTDVVHFFRAFYVVGLSDDVASEHRALVDEYHPERTVGDIGGLGKAFAGELMNRHNIPIQAASKADKLGFVKLFNGALERGKIIIHKQGCEDLLVEAAALQRLPNGKEAPGSNHILDASLYVWRECRAHMYKAPPPKLTDAERMAREEAEARDLLRGRDNRWRD